MDTSQLPLQNKCFVCQSPSFLDTSEVARYYVFCSRCGGYKISSRLAKIIYSLELTDRQRANISGFISENENIFLKEEDLAFFENLRTPTLLEKAKKVMRALMKSCPAPGQQFEINYWALPTVLAKMQEIKGNEFPADENFAKMCRDILPWLATAWAQNDSEFIFIFKTYLRDTTGLLGTGDIDSWNVITPRGWEFLENLNKSTSDSDTGFVAMWFDSTVNPAWLDAIKPAIEEGGYQPVRIDKVEHNNRIDDEIIAGIRACKFLVADFTGQRGGVYFEAGLAQGLAKQVIWLCREDDLKNVHFDTRQYNFILWRPDSLDQLKIALRNRIEATIGKGNFQKI